MAYYNSVEDFCREWGYKRDLKYIKEIVAYFEILMRQPIRIEDPIGRAILVVDDELLKEAEQLRTQKKMPEVTSWYQRMDAKYRFRRIVALSEYVEEQERERQLYEQRKIREEREELGKLQGGVYGIYEDGELVYIGSTNRPFEVRFQEHLDNLRNGDTSLYLYREINKDKEIQFAPLVVKKDLKVEGELTFRDIQAMELALIDQCQPKYNLAGRVVDFRFWKKDQYNGT